MKKLLSFTILALAVAAPMFAQQTKRVTNQGFASDFQTLPVAANLPGVGTTFQSYVSIFNPTSAAYSVTATLYDTTGTSKTATINLAAGEAKVYDNFLADVFNATGGGAVTFSSPASTGGQHNNRFVIDSEIWTGSSVNGATRYGQSVPALEFAGSSSRSFAPGISVDSNRRTNAGCFNQSDSTNTVTIKTLDKTGQTTIGSTTLTLMPHAWGQTSILSVVTNGTLQFDPTDNAVCYAVVVLNANGDARFIPTSEYQP